MIVDRWRGISESRSVTNRRRLLPEHPRQTTDFSISNRQPTSWTFSFLPCLHARCERISSRRMAWQTIQYAKRESLRPCDLAQLTSDFAHFARAEISRMARKIINCLSLRAASNAGARLLPIFRRRNSQFAAKNFAHVTHAAKARCVGDLFDRKIRLDEKPFAPRKSRELNLLANCPLKRALKPNFERPPR